MKNSIWFVVLMVFVFIPALMTGGEVMAYPTDSPDVIDTPEALYAPEDVITPVFIAPLEVGTFGGTAFGDDNSGIVTVIIPVTGSAIEKDSAQVESVESPGAGWINWDCYYFGWMCELGGIVPTPPAGSYDPDLDCQLFGDCGDDDDVFIPPMPTHIPTAPIPSPTPVPTIPTTMPTAVPMPCATPIEMGGCPSPIVFPTATPAPIDFPTPVPTPENLYP